MPNEKKKKNDPKTAPAPEQPAAQSAHPTSANALASIKSEMAALSPGDFTTINVDIPQAVAVVLGVIPHLSAFRPIIAKALPDHPITTLDKLEVYALAAYHAHILWLPPETPENRVATLLDEATPLRAGLLVAAEALAHAKLLDSKVVAKIRADRGNVDTANDLVALGALLLKSWSAIKDKTAVTLEDVQRAGQLGPLLLAALGIREHGVSDAPDALADQRRRAFTLFFRAYDETRRALFYLRWHEGDAEQLAPSLYKGRGGRPASTPAEASPTAAEPPKTPGDEGSPTG